MHAAGSSEAATSAAVSWLSGVWLLHLVLLRTLPLTQRAFNLQQEEHTGQKGASSAFSAFVPACLAAMQPLPRAIAMGMQQSQVSVRG